MNRIDSEYLADRPLSKAYDEDLERSVAGNMPAARRRGLASRLVTLLIASIVIPACATLPSGELQLGPKIAEDLKAQRAASLSTLSRGRPVYLEAHAYPQMLESGDIWVGGPILVNLGREEVTLDALVGHLAKPEEPDLTKDSKDKGTQRRQQARK